MDCLRRNLILPNLLAALVIFCLTGGGYALANSGASDPQAGVAAPQTGSANEQETSTEPETPHKHGKGHGRHGHHGDQPESDAEHGGGPPPWAPAHGWRCQQAGNAPGSAAFKACVKGQID